MLLRRRCPGGEISLAFCVFFFLSSSSSASIVKSVICGRGRRRDHPHSSVNACMRRHAFLYPDPMPVGQQVDILLLHRQLQHNATAPCDGGQAHRRITPPQQTNIKVTAAPPSAHFIVVVARGGPPDTRRTKKKRGRNKKGYIIKKLIGSND